jgi:hypothetical protein
VQGQSTQPVQVRSKEVSVHLGSYPGDSEGDRPVEASGTEIRLGGSASVRAATRLKPEQAPKGLMRAPSLRSLNNLIATLHDPAVIRKILAHLARSHSGQSPGPAPPESGAAAS